MMLLTVGFWERRAMEALPMVVLVLIVAGGSYACGWIASKIKDWKNRKENKPAEF